jgi:uncharacterized protein
MTTIFTPDQRLALLTHIVLRCRDRGVGRTQLMKFMYFLQELKNVPLGYDFRLFNYGPYDSEVLCDLASASGRIAVIEETIQYATSYRYSIKPGSRADQVIQEVEEFDPSVYSAVDEVLNLFGNHSSSELELRSTIFFVDREFKEKKNAVHEAEIVERVHKIKAHFDEPAIRKRVDEMRDQGLLLSVSTAREEPESVASSK